MPLLGYGVPRLDAQQQIFVRYGVPDGLKNMSVKCLLQDRIGYLWVGTDNGLFRFDGIRFQEFAEKDGLSNGEIRALAESPRDGEIWAATAAGIVHSSHGRFVPDSAPLPASPGMIRAISFDQAGQMYVQHAAGIFHRTTDFVGGFQYEAIVSGETHGMQIEPDGMVFGWRGELWLLRNGHAQPIGTPAGLPQDNWGGVLRDVAGNLWVRSATRLWEKPTGATRFIDRGQGIPHAEEQRIIADGHGQIFVATLSGLVALDGDRRIPMDENHGLDGQSVNSMLVDKDDQLWIGLSGGGLAHRMGHGEWLAWKRQDGLLHNSVWSVEHDRTGSVWVGSSAGLNRLNPEGKVERAWTSKNGLPGDRVMVVRAVEGGDVFVGDDPAGLAQFSLEGRLLHVYGRKEGLGNRIMGLRVGPTGDLWLAGDGGLFRSRTPVRGLSGETLHFDKLEIPGLTAPDVRFYDLVFDSAGWAWVATSHGLLHSNGQQSRLFTHADGLPVDDVVAIARHNEAVWISFRDSVGVVRTQLEGQHLAVQRFTHSNGVGSDAVYGIAFDTDGRMWLTTDKGADLLDQGRWHHFDSSKGLVWEDTNSRAIDVDGQGDVWIGTSNGLSRYARPNFVAAARDHNVVITDITAHNSFEDGNHVLTLPYADRDIALRFSNMDLTSWETKFRYRLLGYDDRWTDSPRHSVHFNALPGGSYTFEIEAADEQGHWLAPATTFKFRIERPWWQTWWFATACVLALAALVRGLLRLRMRKLITQKEVLQRKVDEQTAELLESHRQLEAIAYFDLLTSLPNRRMFAEDFRKRLAAARRNGGAFALLLLDLDLFKQVNDAYGHDAGDAVLMETAVRLRGAVRETDCVARLGGDEFAILLDTGDKVVIEEICARILESCREPIPYDRGKLRVGASLGIAVYSADGETEDALYRSADVALYHTKRTSRNSYCWYGSIRPVVNEPEDQGNSAMVALPATMPQMS